MDQHAPQLNQRAVLFLASASEYLQGYTCLLGHPDVYWIGQSEFRSQVIAYVATSDAPLVQFLVDDDIFFGPLPDFEIARGEAYAPRLGWNCTHCWNANRPQKVPTKLFRDPGGEGNLDFDCTWSMDGHVYWREDVLPFLKSYKFANPNDIEYDLSSIIRPRLRFAEHSCLVGIPNNVVSVSTGNRSMQRSAKDLNELFLDGYRIDLDTMDFSDVRSVHQDIEYRFKKVA
jgi:hypothetical protein